MTTGARSFLIAPEHAGSYDRYRLFWGTPSDLRERLITSFSRGLSIGGTTTVIFDTESGSATLSYSYPYPYPYPYPLPDTGGVSQGSLALGAKTNSLSGDAPATVPEGAQFLCR